MPMCAGGISKLIEECGELVQTLGKKLAYYHTDEHPDGAGSLRARIEDEIADVMAAAEFVAHTHRLDWARIRWRVGMKLSRFTDWHALPNNNEHGIDRHG